MRRRDAVGKSFVHPDHQGLNTRVGKISGDHAAKPFHLSFTEFIFGSVVESDEIYSAINPVVIGMRPPILRIVFQSLRAQYRGIQPLGEVVQVILAVAVKNHFMIADAQENRNGAKTRNLVLAEIPPRRKSISDMAGESVKMTGSTLHVFVDGRHPAEVSQMPVESSILFSDAVGNCRHHNVAAIS